MHTKHMFYLWYVKQNMFDREKLRIVIFGGLNTFMPIFIKPQVPKTLNLQDLTEHKVTLTICDKYQFLMS